MERIKLASLGARYRGEADVAGAYDAIVIGSGMGGLAASSLLAQHGVKVLLLEQNDLLGGCTQAYERKGYRWNVGVHYIGSVGGPTTTRKLFDAVCPGIEWAPLPAVYNRMAIGERVYRVPAGREPYRAMLREHFPKEREAIDAYLSAVSAVTRSSVGYFGQKAYPEDAVAPRYEALTADFHAHSDRTTAEALAQLTDDPELRAVWTANWGDYSLPPSRSSFAMHCMLVKHYLDGAWFPVGGPVAFAAKALPLVEVAGGKVLRAAEVAEVLVEGKRTVGVRLRDGVTVRAPLVVSNAGAQNTFGRLLAADVAERHGLRDRVASLKDSYCVVGLNLGLRATGRELGLDPANVWAHPSADFDANLDRHRRDFEAPFPWSFITFPSVKDPDWDRDYPGRATVEMFGYTSFEHFERWSHTNVRNDAYTTRKERIGARLLDELERFAPGVRDAVEVMEVSTPLSYERYLKRRRGGFMGYEASPARFRARWLRAPTPIPGLFLSGQDVTSDGVIGALSGGLLAASAVLGKNLMQEIVGR
ncbi:MAG: NAD(P)/FAD-dependent oxidoreductase [Myxococcota bacterium]